MTFETRQNVSVHYAKEQWRLERDVLEQCGNPYSILTTAQCAIATHGEHGTRLTMRVKSTIFPLLKKRHVSVAAGQNRAFQCVEFSASLSRQFKWIEIRIYIVDASSQYSQSSFHWHSSAYLTRPYFQPPLYLYVAMHFFPCVSVILATAALVTSEPSAQLFEPFEVAAFDFFLHVLCLYATLRVMTDWHLFTYKGKPFPAY